jgi:hypothetical protein
MDWLQWAQPSTANLWLSVRRHGRTPCERRRPLSTTTVDIPSPGSVRATLQVRTHLRKRWSLSRIQTTHSPR